LIPNIDRFGIKDSISMATELIPILTKDERAKLAKVLKVSSRYPTGRRNAAMIALALHCGLRASEICGHERRDGGGLRIKDVDLQTGELTLRDTKDTRKTRAKKIKAGRIVWADEDTLEFLRGYYSDRVKLPHEPEDFFFTTRMGTRVENRAFRAAYGRYAERAGIAPEKRHPHALRHSYASETAREAPLHVLQKILGHGTLSATSRYLHASNADVKEVMTRGRGI
jgi:integrase/recombinase XerD